MRALDEIARRRGVSRAEAARQAIAETAERERRRRNLAAEAATLAKNPDHVREARSTIVVCPTSSSTPPASFHPEVEIGEEPTRVMCELVGAVDARMLGEQVGQLTLDEIKGVDEALELVLDLG